jgi:TPR repeat protein
MKLSGREQADITGLIGQYAHGNEPSRTQLAIMYKNGYGVEKDVTKAYDLFATEAPNKSS